MYRKPNPECQTIKVQWEAQPAAHGSRRQQPRSMIMQDQSNETPTAQKRVLWNKGKVTGAKPPLRPKHVWSIRTKLQIEGRVGISLCSIWQSTVSCVAVTSSRSR